MTAVFLSVPKCSELSGLSKDALYKLIHAGTVKYFKVGKKFLIDYPALMEYLSAEAEKTVKGDQNAGKSKKNGLRVPDRSYS